MNQTQNLIFSLVFLEELILFLQIDLNFCSVHKARKIFDCITWVFLINVCCNNTFFDSSSSFFINIWMRQTISLIWIFKLQNLIYLRTCYLDNELNNYFKRRRIDLSSRIFISIGFGFDTKFEIEFLSFEMHLYSTSYSYPQPQPFVTDEQISQ